MHIIIAQTDALADKALDTIVQAIQGGLVGVAIILAAAIIILAVVIMIVIRELLRFNGRLATSIEKMDETLDKMTIQQSQQNMLFAELTATLREIPQMYKKMLEEMGLVRSGLAETINATGGLVTAVQNEIKDLMTVLDRRLVGINGKLEKIKPDTQPIPVLPDASLAALPEAPKPDLLEDKSKAGDT